MVCRGWERVSVHQGTQSQKPLGRGSRKQTPFLYVEEEMVSAQAVAARSGW